MRNPEKVSSKFSISDTLAVAAVVASHGERGPGHLFSERDWSLGATEDCLPYYASKRLAEERAGALQRGQARWDLVSIQPAVVQGPPLGACSRRPKPYEESC